MDELINESVTLGHEQGRDFLKFCEKNFLNISLKEAIEKYEEIFHLVQKGL